MTRALSIPPDATARMMMLVRHDNKARRIREEAITNLEGTAASSRQSAGEEHVDSAEATADSP